MEKGKISSKKMEHLERKTELLDSPKKKGNSADGPPRISASMMEQELINAGFSVLQKLFPTDSLYVVIAKKGH